jgi:hypothetical protein
MLHQPVRSTHAQAFELRQPQPELCIVRAQVSLSHSRFLNCFPPCVGALLKSQNMRCGGKRKVSHSQVCGRWWVVCSTPAIRESPTCHVARFRPCILP